MPASARTERKRLVAAWLRLHRTNERRFAREAAAFFADQGKRIVSRLRGHGTITPIDVEMAFDLKSESDRFIRTVARPQLLRIAMVGAEFALHRLRPAKAIQSIITKDWEDDGEGGEGGGAGELGGNPEDYVTLPLSELPTPVLEAVYKTLDDTFQQGYWQKVQGDQREDIIQAIRNGLDSGKFYEDKLAKAIEEATGGAISRKRAARIARTETTCALNSGRVSAIDDLVHDGLKVGRTWIAVMDKHVRKSHRAMNNVVAPAGELFHVGPSRSPAPYPGWHGLPARERVFCRCTIIADLSQADILEMSGENAGRSGRGRGRGGGKR